MPPSPPENPAAVTSKPSSGKSAGWRRWALGCAGLLLVAIVGIAVLVASLDQPRPEIQPSPEADRLAREMMAAVNVDAWQQTGAIAWDFAGRQQHLWDRQRGLARVSWGDGKEALVDLSTQEGRAYSQGEEVTGEEGKAMVAAAWASWCNDSFWLNPVAKAFDDGTSRSLVQLDDEDSEGRSQGLLVAYSSGGVTPGDAYLWLLDDEGRPTAWRMWTRILPIGGIETSWEGWIELPTGAWVATRHALPIGELELSEIHAAADLEALASDGRVTGLEPGEDPFAPLFE